MVVPRFICLDSSTLGKLAKDRCAGSGATEVIRLLNSGEIVPFLTWQHFEELFQHRNFDVYRRRIDFLYNLRMVGFPSNGLGGVGGFVELRDHEFNTVLAHPNGSFPEIIDRTRDLVRNGFDTGENLCRTQRESWDCYREHFAARDLQSKVEIASLTHFPVVDPKRRYPISGRHVRLKPKAKAEVAFVQMATALTSRMQEAGDPRVHNSRRLAFSLLKEAFDDAQPLYAKPDFCVQDLLSLYGVDASRLPSNPLVEDVSYEGIFAQHLRQFGRRSLKDRGTVFRITQNKVPSWMVWRGADRMMKNSGKASGSNLNDKYLLPFGLYVDAMEVDKRVRHIVQQLKRTSDLFKRIGERLLDYDVRGGYKELAKTLKKLAAQSTNGGGG